MTGRTGGLFEKVLTPTQGEISVWVFFCKKFFGKFKNQRYSAEFRQKIGVLTLADIQ